MLTPDFILACKITCKNVYHAFSFPCWRVWTKSKQIEWLLLAHHICFLINAAYQFQGFKEYKVLSYCEIQHAYQAVTSQIASICINRNRIWVAPNSDCRIQSVLATTIVYEYDFGIYLERKFSRKEKHSCRTRHAGKNNLYQGGETEKAHGYQKMYTLLKIHLYATSSCVTLHQSNNQ